MPSSHSSSAQAPTPSSSGAGFIRSVLFVSGAALMIDSTWLVATGRFNFGIILPGFIGLVFLLMTWRWHALSRWRQPPAPAWRSKLWRLGWTLFFLWLASVAIFFAFIARDHSIRSGESRTEAPSAILVLGSGTPNCVVSPTLAARLDAALVSAKRWPQALVVVSGGQDRGLRCTEAGVMASYLTERGLPSARVLLEPRSTSTAENLQFSRTLLADRHGRDPSDTSLLIVTSDFHTLRARMIAAKAGFRDIASLPTPTPLSVRYNAWLREYFAFISGRLLGEY